MTRVWTLYIFGLLAVAFSITFPALAWLSPFTFVLIFPLCIAWLWKREGRPLGDLGYRFSDGWLRYLGIGLLLGATIPAFFQVVQIVGGWATLAPREVARADLVFVLLAVFIKMVFLVAIEEFVFRGFFLQTLSRWRGFLFAALGSSLLWGAGHLVSMVTEGLTPGLIIIGMITFIAWGITLSFCYLLANNSLWLPYGLHLGVNLSFSIISVFFINQPIAAQWWVGHPAWAPESGLLGAITWACLALLTYSLASSTRHNLK